MFALPVYQLRGLDVAMMGLRRRMRKLDNWRDPLVLVAADFYKLQRGWLESEGRASWQALSPRYAAWKQRKVGTKPILQFTGAMHADLTGMSSGSVTIRRDRLTLRTPRSGNRWKLHAEGRGRRPVRNPLSPALRLRRPTWNKILRDWATSS
jgi:hypothetical protein